MWVLHEDRDHGPVSDRIDIHTIVVPPGRPFEIKNDFFAKLFLKHKHYHGLVEVEFVTDDNGIHLNTDKARTEAKEALRVAEKQRIADYINTQLEDRIKHNSPALPPDQTTARVIRKHGVDLGKYGIRPVGWSLDEAELHAIDPRSIPKDDPATLSEMQELRNQNKVMAEHMRTSDDLIRQLMNKLAASGVIELEEPEATAKAV